MVGMALLACACVHSHVCTLASLYLAPPRSMRLSSRGSTRGGVHAFARPPSANSQGLHGLRVGGLLLGAREFATSRSVVTGRFRTCARSGAERPPSPPALQQSK
eukprot:10305349-Alexandrium_andersonii.AAC.1